MRNIFSFLTATILAALVLTGCTSSQGGLIGNDTISKSGDTTTTTTTLAAQKPSQNAGPIATTSNCGLELGIGEIRIIPAGCIIVGDVYARTSSNQEWVWTTDAGPVGQLTGSVEKLDKAYEIKAPYGAGVYDGGVFTVDILKEEVARTGCDRGNGCPRGAIGWLTKP